MGLTFIYYLVSTVKKIGAIKTGRIRLPELL